VSPLFRDELLVPVLHFVSGDRGKRVASYKFCLGRFYNYEINKLSNYWWDYHYPFWSDESCMTEFGTEKKLQQLAHQR
jgi:hypothetical protein